MRLLTVTVLVIVTFINSTVFGNLQLSSSGTPKVDNFETVTFSTDRIILTGLASQPDSTCTAEQEGELTRYGSALYLCTDLKNRLLVGDCPGSATAPVEKCSDIPSKIYFKDSRLENVTCDFTDPASPFQFTPTADNTVFSFIPATEKASVDGVRFVTNSYATGSDVEAIHLGRLDTGDNSFISSTKSSVTLKFPVAVSAAEISVTYLAVQSSSGPDDVDGSREDIEHNFDGLTAQNVQAFYIIDQENRFVKRGGTMASLYIDAASVGGKLDMFDSVLTRKETYTVSGLSPGISELIFMNVENDLLREAVDVVISVSFSYSNIV